MLFYFFYLKKKKQQLIFIFHAKIIFEIFLYSSIMQIYSYLRSS